MIEVGDYSVPIVSTKCSDILYFQVPLSLVTLKVTVKFTAQNGENFYITERKLTA